ncbi:MAG: hypothetical protein H6P96_1306, partial [Candidatus Aminicenantes bacterium]|nr:hypothetical protein [Candidatus Aminicenantes bacterium]
MEDKRPCAFLVVLVLTITALSCGAPETPREYTLVWSEEFAVDGLPDPATWSYETGLIRNQEAQYYTAGRPENARVENGCLVIEARKEEYAGAHYTSAS